MPRQGSDRQRRRGQRLAGQARRPWYAPAKWMWSKRPRKASTWTGLAGWLFVLAGIASFLAFKGTTSLLTVSFCAVGFGVSAYADHRMRNKTYGRGSETVRPMSRAEARSYVGASREGGGRVPEPSGDGRTWVRGHDRTGTDGVDGHYRATAGGERVAEREREHAGQRKRDDRARTRAPDIDGEWWEGGD